MQYSYAIYCQIFLSNSDKVNKIVLIQSVFSIRLMSQFLIIHFVFLPFYRQIKTLGNLILKVVKDLIVSKQSVDN